MGITRREKGDNENITKYETIEIKFYQIEDFLNIAMSYTLSLCQC